MSMLLQSMKKLCYCTENFTEVSKNLTRHRFENKFVRPSK